MAEICRLHGQASRAAGGAGCGWERRGRAQEQVQEQMRAQGQQRAQPRPLAEVQERVEVTQRLSSRSCRMTAAGQNEVGSMPTADDCLQPPKPRRQSSAAEPAGAGYPQSRPSRPCSSSCRRELRWPAKRQGESSIAGSQLHPVGAAEEQRAAPVQYASRPMSSAPVA